MSFYQKVERHVVPFLFRIGVIFQYQFQGF